ncbi:IclR family transcriptional regulator [Pigmentiphaga sp.]|uniref:IclR family transcriptional regulator n=1 Tax=Pigmentiphaga sp. TaxID=1977564 RepID=UPI0025CF51FF|nr:IclR family transcriptional regulator [Pigmentiphaga sp.]
MLSYDVHSADLFERKGVAEIEKLGDSVRAVDRALEILQAFTATDCELTVGQLLKRVDLSRPTLYRLLYTLEQRGFVVSEGDPQKFRLGPAVGQLAHAWSSSQDLAALAAPLMQKLREETGETVALFVLEGGDRLCIAELPSTQPLSFKRGIGYREKISVGASGRAILANIGETAEDRLDYARTQGLDVSRPVEDLDMVKRRGYAISKDELIQGAVAIAAPFFNHSGRVAGSLGVFGPSARLPEQRIREIGEMLVREAAELSRTLGLRS